MCMLHTMQIDRIICYNFWIVWLQPRLCSKSGISVSIPKSSNIINLMRFECTCTYKSEKIKLTNKRFHVVETVWDAVNLNDAKYWKMEHKLNYLTLTSICFMSLIVYVWCLYVFWLFALYNIALQHRYISHK